MKNYYIIDFDSTFTQVEALDELAKISLEHHPDREQIYLEIERYTNLAMEGKLSFVRLFLDVFNCFRQTEVI